MAPLRTAVTTAASRRATQRFVSAGGKWELDRSMVHLGQTMMFCSCACLGELPKFFGHSSRFQRLHIEIEVVGWARAAFASAFCLSLTQSLVQGNVSKK